MSYNNNQKGGQSQQPGQQKDTFKKGAAGEMGKDQYANQGQGNPGNMNRPGQQGGQGQHQQGGKGGQRTGTQGGQGQGGSNTTR